MRNIALLVFLLPVWVHAITIGHSEVQPTCTSSNGSIDVAAYGGVPPYTYVWSDGPITEDRTDLPPGSYTITVTDSNGDPADATILLEAQPYLGNVQFSFVLDGDTYFPCPGLSNGIVVLPVYETADWSGLNGVLPFNVSVLLNGDPVQPDGADSYGNPYFMGIADNDMLDITITDAVGCLGNSYTMASGPPLVGATVSEVVDACAGGANGSIAFTPHPEFLGWLGRLHVYDGTMTEVFVTDPFADPLIATGLLPDNYSISITYGPEPAFVCTGQFLDPMTVVGDMGPDCGLVEGTLFIDNDQDCAQGPAEVSLPYRVLEIQPGGLYAITDSAGSFNRNLPNGNYTLDVIGADLLPLCPAVMPTPFTIANNTATLTLADSSVVPLDLAAQCWAGAARPGFAHHVHVSVGNSSAQVSGALTTTLTFDPQINFVSAVPAPSSVTGNVVVWSTAALAAYGYFSAHVTLQVPADVGLLGLPFVHSVVAVQPLGEVDLANNTDGFSGVFTGAYDPNDKTAYTSSGLSEALYFVNEDEYIDYRIQFQNTGTDTAFTVVVTDTISAMLDLATFTQGVASHPFSIGFKPGRVVEWRFTNIQLPDSNVNEASSHGLVTFRIRPVPLLVPGTELRNNADIFFDFNPPIRTNDAVLVAEASTGLADTSDDALQLFPNPVHTTLTLDLPEGTPTGELRITAPDGRIVLHQRATRTVDVEQLAPGLYVVSLRTAAGLVYQTRVVKN